MLNEAREDAKKLLNTLHNPADEKESRTYRKRTRKDYLKHTKSRKHAAKTTCKAIGKQLPYLWRDLATIDSKISLRKELTKRQAERLDMPRTIMRSRSICTIAIRTTFLIGSSA